MMLVAVFNAALTEGRADTYNGEIAFTYHQPDGSTFSVKVYGDEFFAYQRTLEGREIIMDPQTGFFCYARLATDGQSFKSTGIPVVTADDKSRETSKVAALAAGAAAPYQLLPNKAVMARVRAAQQYFRVDAKGRPLPPNQKHLPGKEEGPQPGPPSRTTLGDFVGLCLLIDFPDDIGTITPGQVDNYCNQPSGYTDFGNACSINEYFRIQSNGKFNFTNVVPAYVRMPNPKSYYDNNLPYSDGKARELVNTALDILIAQGFDFSLLSRDSSGYIYSINVFYAGNRLSGWALGLWPHSGGIPARIVDAANNIRAYRYQMTDMRSSLSIGTFCHENGHMTCQFPDLYSYANHASVVRSYSLMCSSGGLHPTNIDPYLKMKAGWADIVEVNSATNLRAAAQEDRNFYYKYTNPAESREYFIFENRNNAGYEGPYGGHASSVTPGYGLVIWHIFEGGSNTYSSIQQSGTYTTPYEAFLIEASPTGSYTPWYSNPNPSPNGADTFHAAQGADPLNDATLPELRFWDHAGDTGHTVASGLTLHSYSALGPTLSYTIGIGDPVSSPSIGLTVTAIDAACNLGDSPANQIFSVFNTGGGALTYAISDDATWLDCTPTTGTMMTTTSMVTVSFDTAALSSGQYNATITVTDAGADNSPQIFPVTVTVADAAVLSVGPVSISEELWPNETSNSNHFAIANSGGGTLSYTVANNAAWLTLSRLLGSCSTESDLVYLDINPSGTLAGTYYDTVTISSPEASNSPLTVDVELIVHEGIAVSTPDGGETWYIGGGQTIEWMTSVATDLKIELLKGGVVERVIAAATPNDGSFDWTPPGDLTPGSDYRIRITTTDDAFTDESDADFAIHQVIHQVDMSTDPGWTLEGLWAWGQPTGQGGNYGNPDPSVGYTGANVIGYNLNGDYPNDLSRQYVSTVAIDCTGYNNTSLSFMRWLGVESSIYDSAGIEVSNNGASWTAVWTNPATSLNGGAWEEVQYDISAVADNQATVYVRWYMGDTDVALDYCGWNIDDVMVLGESAFSTVTFQTDGTPGATLSGATSQTILSGNNCTPVTANAPAGWGFVNWTESGGLYSTANPLTVHSVTKDMTLTANFTPTYTLNYSTGASGSISGATSQTIAHGRDGTPVTAEPNTGYHFVQWSDGSTTNPRTDTNVTANISVMAGFAINQYTLTYTAGANGSISGATPQTVWHGGGGSAVTAVPNTGYHFVQWSDGSTANPRTDTNVTAQTNVIAIFAINTYTLSIIAEHGSVQKTPDQSIYDLGTAVILTAIPEEGHHFVEWLGDVTGSENPATLMMDGDQVVTAMFSINTYTLSIIAEHGSVQKTPDQSIYDHGTTLSLMAIPNTGYVFTGWSGDAQVGHELDNPQVMVMDENKSLQASFAEHILTSARHWNLYK